jgi:S-methylmethionine-dependent homocysteine/selenocysteine methylase
VREIASGICAAQRQMAFLRSCWEAEGATLPEGHVHFLDGGMGTALGNVDPYLAWNPFAALLNPSAVRAVHAAFLGCGSTVVTSASYACTPRLVQRVVWLAALTRELREAFLGQIGCDLADDPSGAHETLDAVDRIVKAMTQEGGVTWQPNDNDTDTASWSLAFACAEAAVGEALAAASAHVRAGCTREIKVALCCPPLADSYDPHPAEGEMRFYAGLGDIGRRNRVDVFLVETVSNSTSATHALEALSGFAATSQQIWLSFVPRCSGSGPPRLLSAETLGAALDRVWQSSREDRCRLPDALLANCGSIQACVLSTGVYKATKQPFGMYANDICTDADIDHAPFRFEAIVEGWFGKDAVDAEEEAEEEEEEAGEEAAEAFGSPLEVGRRGAWERKAPAKALEGDAMQMGSEETTGAYCRAVSDLRLAGGTVVGGCCGVEPPLLARLIAAYRGA